MFYSHFCHCVVNFTALQVAAKWSNPVWERENKVNKKKCEIYADFGPPWTEKDWWKTWKIQSTKSPVKISTSNYRGRSHDQIPVIFMKISKFLDPRFLKNTQNTFKNVFAANSWKFWRTFYLMVYMLCTSKCWIFKLCNWHSFRQGLLFEGRIAAIHPWEREK